MKPIRCDDCSDALCPKHAATDDLLAACKRAAEVLDGRQSAAKICRAAIAKAEGQMVVPDTVVEPPRTPELIALIHKRREEFFREMDAAMDRMCAKLAQTKVQDQWFGPGGFTTTPLKPAE